jgi:hypothetical protein
MSALAGAGAASASTTGKGTFTCSGTSQSPGTLAGTFSRVVVRGVCAVNAGPAKVRGNLTIARNGVLLAVFALNDVTHTGRSNLTVGGNLRVRRGGTLIMGCAAETNPCLDDPNPNSPTLSSSSSVGGNLIAHGALGVVVHSSTIGGNVIQIGGGGGRDCTPKGIFELFMSPVYSDYEDSVVGRNMVVIGLRSCWYGTIRDNLHGNVLLAGNKLADPDAMEVVTNHVRGNLMCFRNDPAVQFGDSGGMPNEVRGHAAGQCGFDVLQPNPAPTATTPAGPLQHISIHVRHHHQTS